jgi:mRNA interferase HigB
MISWRRLREFLENHSGRHDARKPLERWYKIVEGTPFRNFSHVREVFPSADQVGRFVVFNVGANKFRVIAEIDYTKAIVLIRHVLTHAEYDAGRWKV